MYHALSRAFKFEQNNMTYYTHASALLSDHKTSEQGYYKLFHWTRNRSANMLQQLMAADSATADGNKILLAHIFVNIIFLCPWRHITVDP